MDVGEPVVDGEDLAQDGLGLVELTLGVVLSAEEQQVLRSLVHRLPSV